MRTRLETLHIDIARLEQIECHLMSPIAYHNDKLSDEIQSDVRMLFNEALAGGPNMNGDGGPTLNHNHALDCVWAAKRIFEFELIREAAGAFIRDMRERYPEEPFRCPYVANLESVLEQYQ